MFVQMAITNCEMVVYLLDENQNKYNYEAINVYSS